MAMMIDNEEPMPTVTAKSKPVQAYAIRLITNTIEEQWEKGKAKYGSDLMTHNGRDASTDAMQELADAVVYVAQMRVEMGDMREEIASLAEQRNDFINMLSLFALCSIDYTSGMARCIFCGSEWMTWMTEKGLVHSDTCVVKQARDLLEHNKEKYGY
jgi:hypothetical protein